MENIEVLAPAKINLTLDVVGKRPDGYHDVEMIMQSLQLHDILTLHKIDEGIQLTCNWPEIPLTEGNLVYKAALALKDRTGYIGGVRIHIHKEIPMEAGLAGGSSDAAAALKGLNQLWALNLTNEELSEIGSNIGADIPFCLLGGTAIARGKGEILEPLQSPPKLWIVLAKPSLGVSTAKVYQNFKLDHVEKGPDTDVMVMAIKQGDFQGIVDNLCNVLESVTLKLHPELNDIKSQLSSLGASGVLMSGSGPTIFAIFKEEALGKRAVEVLKEKLPQVFLTQTT